MAPYSVRVRLSEIQPHLIVCSNEFLKIALNLIQDNLWLRKTHYFHLLKYKTILKFSIKRIRIAKYFGNRCIVKLLVHFRRAWHFEQVGISSPSRISSRMNKSKQASNLQRDDDGSETLKSQNGSKVTLVLPHVVHFNVLFNWPTNRSLMTEFSTLQYHSQVRSAFLLSLSRIIWISPKSFPTF